MQLVGWAPSEAQVCRHRVDCDSVQGMEAREAVAIVRRARVLRAINPLRH